MATFIKEIDMGWVCACAGCRKSIKRNAPNQKCKDCNNNRCDKAHPLLPTVIVDTELYDWLVDYLNRPASKEVSEKLRHFLNTPTVLDEGENG